MSNVPIDYGFLNVQLVRGSGMACFLPGSISSWASIILRLRVYWDWYFGSAGCVTPSFLFLKHTRNKLFTPKWQVHDKKARLLFENHRLFLQSWKGTLRWSQPRFFYSLDEEVMWKRKVKWYISRGVWSLWNLGFNMPSVFLPMPNKVNSRIGLVFLRTAWHKCIPTSYLLWLKVILLDEVRQCTLKNSKMLQYSKRFSWVQLYPSAV